MTNSKATPAPKKPRPDFPLTPRADGRWCKKVKGRVHIFTGTAQEALDEWNRIKGDLYAGRTPRPKQGGLLVVDLCDKFLVWKQELVDSGELAPRTFGAYKITTDFLVDHFGKHREVADLRTEDFQALRAKMARRWSPIPLANHVQVVRSVFKYGYDAELLDKPVRFGLFKKPSAKVMRHARTANGPKMFKPAQIRALLDHAKPNMRAMILLGVNGGLGNSDLAELRPEAFDLDGGWLDYPRGKTGIPRRIPLWPETVQAVRDVLRIRPDDVELLFIGPRGQDYLGNRRGYRVTQEFDRAAAAAKVAGRTFYDLRRTFQTVAEGSNDLAAVQSIMGHAPASGDMSSIYRQRIDDARLRAVVNHVRKWVGFGAAKRKAK